MTAKRGRTKIAGGGAQLGALISNAELQDVVFLELQAVRQGVEDVSQVEQPDVPMKVWYRAGEGQIQVRCRLEIQTDDAHFMADAVADFAVEGNLPTDDSVQQGFTQRIGVAVVYPYLREAVHDMARKMGVDPPILSLIAETLEALHPTLKEA
ncbi:hypothetical protein ACFU3E_14185 [Streptomyces sp. NPDC057424]|uniref:hypothetical protein n=1 Tax=Streptomyces sp. NPDC057424 TaxID=3346127 RepID=UPI003675836F